MVQTVAILGSVIVSALGAVFGLYQARKADRSATTTRTIELGVTQLVDQYRKANEELVNQTKSCTQRCAALETKSREQDQKIEGLEARVDELTTEVQKKDDEIRRLKIQLGAQDE